jgi:hypothetical protein
MAFQDCINRINKAAGRTLTDDELANIVTRVNREVAALAKQHGFATLQGGLPEVAALPPGLIREAALKATKELIHEAQKKRQRVALTIIAHDKIKSDMAQHATPADGLGAVLERVYGRTKATENTYMARLLDTLTATNPRFFGLVEDAAGIRDLVREMFGEDTGNATAKKGAKAWAETAEDMRHRFNRAGGDVGRLDTWGMPQSHDMQKVRAAGKPAWVDYVMDRIDRSAYVRDDGLQMADAQIRETIGAAWDTIASDGLNKIKPGTVQGKGMRAKRGSESRVIHFKDADAWLDYHQQYSGRGIYATIVGHVAHLSRDIGLVEELGPNPSHQFGYWRDVVRQSGASGMRVNYLENLFSQLDGSANAVVDARLARFGQGARNWQVASKLVGAVLSSVTDFATAAVTAGYNRLPPLRFARNVITALNPLDASDVRLAQRAGLGLETLIGELNRWGEDSIGHGWSAKLSSATMRASGLAGLTEANRRSFGVTMAATLGDLTAKDWGDLHASDRAQLTHYGIKAADWTLLQKVTPEDWGGPNNRVLTVASIRQLSDADIGATGAAAARIRDSLSTRALDMVLAETDFAVVTPGAKERALMFGVSAQKGTAGGEFARTMWLFKSFPVAVISKHWMRGWGMNTAGGKAAYLGSFAVGTMALGAVALQLKDVTKGKEPRDMDTAAFWGAAFAQGGGVGIFGDYLFSNQSRFGRSVAETAAGPVFGGVIPDLYDLTVGNVHEAAGGDATHAGAEALRFAQSNTPLINMWYTRAILDRLVFQQMQEYLSPGYLARMRERARKDTGQEYWNQ